MDGHAIDRIAKLSYLPVLPLKIEGCITIDDDVTYPRLQKPLAHLQQ
jgi:hypothetical protein